MIFVVFVFAPKTLSQAFVSTLNDNIPLFTWARHYYLDFLLVNSDITGTIGDFT